VGAALAVSFRDPRRRLAFVMVAHTGILLIGVGCLTAQGIAGSAVYAVGDGAVKAALWAGLALLGLSRPADDKLSQPDLPPSRKRAGLTLLTIGAVATAGFPLFATGLGKSAIEDSAAAVGYPWVTPIAVLTAALTGAAMLHVAWVFVRDTPRSSAWVVNDLRGSWAAVFGCGAALLAISAAAAVMGRWATAASARFVDTAGYQQRVLNGVGKLTTQAAPILRLSAGAAVLDLVGVAAAIAMTAGVSRDAVRGLGRILRASTFQAAARRLHDGSIGDSATWATVGTATIALVFATSLR
jgi:formate hydrogenlyase subunit 3/multisubunit Na+/H+ antiporter MnhD subunit